jgi:hypothetical protein
VACGALAAAVATGVVLAEAPAGHHAAVAAGAAPSSSSVPLTSAGTPRPAAQAGQAAPRTPAAGGGKASAAQPSAAGTRQNVAEVRDPEESKSFPVSSKALAHRSAAATPAKVVEGFVAPGALSTGQVKQALSHIRALEHAQMGSSIVPGGDSVGGNGTIPIPAGIPAVIDKVIAGANAITDYPYVYGGGHASFVDNAYDCSGSVGYALAAGGLLSHTETSGELESWGAPGPGQWITVFAAAGHVYMYVNIGGGVWMRYDTVGRSGTFASRWQPASRSNEGFVARHWPGL